MLELSKAPGSCWNEGTLLGCCCCSCCCRSRDIAVDDHTSSLLRRGDEVVVWQISDAASVSQTAPAARVGIVDARLTVLKLFGCCSKTSDPFCCCCCCWNKDKVLSMTAGSSGLLFGDNNQPGIIGGLTDSCTGAMQLPMAKNVLSHSLTTVVPVLVPVGLQEKRRKL